MLELLRIWLNGKRLYAQGVVLFAMVSDNAALLTLFRSGETASNSKRLQDELMRICKQMKTRANYKPPAPEKHPPPPSSLKRKIVKQAKIVEQVIDTAENIVNAMADDDEECANPELYEIARKEAFMAYKDCMNKRAELFASCRVAGFEDINRPDLIEQRSKLAVEVVIAFNKVSELYDRAAHVKEYGILPRVDGEEEESEYNGLPDTLVKSALYNLKQNYNKIKKRELTTERMALLQKHEKNIKKLEERWRLLKPQT